MLKFCSIDVETSGLDPDTDQLLEIGAILYETGVGELERFHCYVYHDKYIGNAYALQMNQEILYRIACREKFADQYNFYNLAEVRKFFGKWLFDNKTKYNNGRNIPAAGKNFASFDRQFLLKAIPNLSTHIGHKSIDPGSMFVSMEDEAVPGLEECLKIAGMHSVVNHNALDDAQQVIDLIEFYFKHRHWGPAHVK